MLFKFYTHIVGVWEMVPIVFQGHPSSFKVTRARKVSILPNFTTFWRFTDDNSSFIVQMALKFYNSLLNVWNMIPIVFEGHPSIFKVTRAPQSADLAQFRHFFPVTISLWTITPVRMDRCFSNFAHTLEGYGRWSLLFFKVIRRVSRSHGPEKCRFCPISPLFDRFRMITPVLFCKWLWNFTAAF